VVILLIYRISKSENYFHTIQTNHNKASLKDFKGISGHLSHPEFPEIFVVGALEILPDSCSTRKDMSKDILSKFV